MTRRGIIAGLLWVTLLSGCMKANEPPSITVQVTPTQGHLAGTPLYVHVRFAATDAEGDPLFIVLDYGNGGITEYMSPQQPRGTPLMGGFDAVISRPGTFRVTATADDGHYVVATEAVATFTGEPVVELLFDATAEVTQPCSGCTDATTLLPRPGAVACVGFLVNANGTDCAWFALRPEWEGRQLEANATGRANADMEFRTDCTPRGESLGMRWMPGGDRWEVPAGARCLVTWTTDEADSVRVVVYRW